MPFPPALLFPLPSSTSSLRSEIHIFLPGSTWEIITEGYPPFLFISPLLTFGIVLLAREHDDFFLLRVSDVTLLCCNVDLCLCLLIIPKTALRVWINQL